LATIEGAQELLDYVRSSKSRIERAAALAHGKVVLESQADAIRNAKAQFTGRNGRRLSGRLFNAIRAGLETPKNGVLEGYLGVFGIPYGQIHEEGGTIKPVKANHLWIKNHYVEAKFKRLTPREFVTEMKTRRNPADKFAILESKSGNLTAFNIKRVGVGSTAREIFQALFYLRDDVEMPKRPYLTPAIVTAINKFPAEFARFLESEVNK
jgi:hypothetical protein